MYTGFSDEASKFLYDMSCNNSKEYFEDNRERYEKFIKAPSQEYVEEMGEHLMALAPVHLNAVPKINGSLFRFYRDTRFAKDKRPMKEEVGLVIWQGENPRLKSSSFYMQFTPTTLFLAVGIRWFDKETRDVYRDHIKIKKNAARLHDIYEVLIQKGYSIPEDKYKRFPKGFKKEDKYSYLALKDAAYVIQSFDVKNLYGEQFIDFAYQHYETMFDLQNYVYEMSLEVEYE